MVVYLTTNLTNNKKYIGKDEKNRKSYLGSGITLQKAIKKYGRENFKKEILEYCCNSHHLQEREEYWLSYYNAANDPLFYNRTNMARGPKKGTKHDVHKKGKDNKNWGKTRTTEQKQKISQAKLGKPSGKLGYKCTDEQRLNLSKPKSKEHTQKIKDRTISDEQKQKMSLSAIGKIKRPKKSVNQYDLQDNFIKEWPSLKEAINETKITSIGDCVRNKQKTAGKFIWKFKF
jgi:group I intron endonuclease